MRLRQFLSVVPNMRLRNVPAVWNEEVRRALSDNLVRVGWGGVLELTDEGHKMLVESVEG